MDNQSYLKALKSKLKPLDRETREEILRELRAAVDDTPDQTLEARFGSVDALAAQYLEDAPDRLSAGRRVGKIFKWVLIVLGALLLLFILFVIWLFNQDGDEFDYADPNAPELGALDWIQHNDPVRSLNIFQSKVVIYSGDYGGVSHSCAHYPEESFAYDVETQQLFIMHNKCYLRIPADLDAIEMNQASVVLNGLNGDKSIEMFQSELRLAQQAPFILESELKDCKMEYPLSEEGRHTLSLQGKQCAIEELRLEE